jgi:hypothetical protein
MKQTSPDVEALHNNQFEDDEFEEFQEREGSEKESNEKLDQAFEEDEDTDE